MKIIFRKIDEIMKFLVFIKSFHFIFRLIESIYTESIKQWWFEYFITNTITQAIFLHRNTGSSTTTQRPSGFSNLIWSDWNICKLIFPGGRTILISDRFPFTRFPLLNRFLLFLYSTVYIYDATLIYLQIKPRGVCLVAETVAHYTLVSLVGVEDQVKVMSFTAYLQTGATQSS